jgi:hypothetical protein
MSAIISRRKLLGGVFKTSVGLIVVPELAAQLRQGGLAVRGGQCREAEAEMWK